jgi:predicted ribosomally synthesized peptide with SipW-like signal peptide
MKKNLWLAMGTGLLATVVGIGSTLALFSDTEGEDVTWTAGRLCLNVNRNDGDPIPGPMFYITPAQGATPGGVPGTFPTGLWAPGDTHQRTMTVENPASCSSMNAWLDSVRATMHPGGYAPMADKLLVTITTPKSGVETTVAQAPLSAFLAGPVPLQYPDGSKVPLYLTSNRHLKFNVHFDIGADNSYQDKTLVVDFAVHATQMKNNP